MMFWVRGNLPPPWDNSGGVQRKTGSPTPCQFSVHPNLKGGSRSHVSVGEHSSGHGLCTQEREQGDFWPCQRTRSSFQGCQSSLATALHHAKPGLCAVCGVWGVRCLSPAKTSAGCARWPPLKQLNCPVIYWQPG